MTKRDFTELADDASAARLRAVADCIAGICEMADVRHAAVLMLTDPNDGKAMCIRVASDVGLCATPITLATGLSAAWQQFHERAPSDVFEDERPEVVVRLVEQYLAEMGFEPKARS